jgi:hypothetical protein
MTTKEGKCIITKLSSFDNSLFPQVLAFLIAQYAEHGYSKLKIRTPGYLIHSNNFLFSMQYNPDQILVFSLSNWELVHTFNCGGPHNDLLAMCLYKQEKLVIADNSDSGDQRLSIMDISSDNFSNWKFDELVVLDERKGIADCYIYDNILYVCDTDQIHQYEMSEDAKGDLTFTLQKQTFNIPGSGILLNIRTYTMPNGALRIFVEDSSSVYVCDENSKLSKRKHLIINDNDTYLMALSDGTLFLYCETNNSIILINAVTLQVDDVWIGSCYGITWKDIRAICVLDYFICISDGDLKCVHIIPLK